jgi:hypothetical protein
MPPHSSDIVWVNVETCLAMGFHVVTEPEGSTVKSEFLKIWPGLNQNLLFKKFSV